MSDSISVQKQSLTGLLSQHLSLVVTAVIMLLVPAALYGLVLLGYSGLSYSIAGQLPWFLLLATLVYLYITMDIVPMLLCVGVFMVVSQAADPYEFPLQSETPVTVKDVDIQSGFLGLNTRYRVETSSGLFITGSDGFYRDQALEVKRYASADGFAELTKLCTKSACVRAEALIPE